MKRDPHLHDLSRDHHHALVLARKASRTAVDGTDEEVYQLWDSIKDMFHEELEPHFQVEEQHILPQLIEIGIAEVVDRTADEHARLRTLVANPNSSRTCLAEFGELLRQHVRFEESELFPVAEQTLSQEQMNVVRLASSQIASAIRRNI